MLGLGRLEKQRRSFPSGKSEEEEENGSWEATSFDGPVINGRGGGCWRML